MFFSPEAGITIAIATEKSEACTGVKIRRFLIVLKYRLYRHKQSSISLVKLFLPRAIVIRENRCPQTKVCHPR